MNNPYTKFKGFFVKLAKDIKAETNKFVKSVKKNFNEMIKFFKAPSNYIAEYKKAKDEMINDKYTPIEHNLDNVLEVNSLKKYFPIKAGFFKRTVGYVKAVDNISFNIKKGTTMGLVGESGCGKT
ncbi:MAG: ATP-binding cassette domain-containing protein, partial [Clostridia bacterium]